MDARDRRLLNEIQSGYPISKRPFEDLGARIGCSESEALERTKKLKQEGIIRRIGGNFDSQRLGFATTLCAARVAQDKLGRFVEVVNRYPEVTHHYLRNHSYNVWFTLVAETRSLIARYIEEIIRQTEVSEIIDLPAVRTFKIQVGFEVGGGR
jgi:DNA-binding Lrp family transcriptional regulator